LADAVITSAAGYPLDLTFYQTIKGVTAAQHIVKPGGRILIVGECPEGIGSPEFAHKLSSFAGNEQYLREIADAGVVVDQWQLEKLALVGLKNELYFYTPGVSPTDLGALGERCFSNLTEAVDRFLDGLPAGARIVLIPEGPYSFARVTV
jgi:lactate racemase